MPTLIESGGPTDAQMRYLTLAKARAGHSYVIPSTEEVFEVHHHKTPIKDTRIISTIRRQRAPETVYQNGHELFPFIQQGIIYGNAGGVFFSTSGNATRQDSRSPLQMLNGDFLCLLRPELIESDTTPSDADLERDNEVMKRLRRGDQIIFLTLFPSYVGRTRNEIRGRNPKR